MKGNLKLFNEKNMYRHVKRIASNAESPMPQTLKALDFAWKAHEGQVRKGEGNVPYIIHPLTVACHALAMNLKDDNLIATCLLHDVLEDCDVSRDELPVSEEVKDAVELLTKNWNVNSFAKNNQLTDFEYEQLEDEYYSRIIENPIATIVKLIDRCNNVFSMASGFTPEKSQDYIKETIKHFYPLLKEAKLRYPDYDDQIFLLRYQITGMVESMRLLIGD